MTLCAANRPHYVPCVVSDIMVLTFDLYPFNLFQFLVRFVVMAGRNMVINATKLKQVIKLGKLQGENVKKNQGI